MHVAIYLRQSHDKHGDGLAVARQRKDCVALCKARGWTWTAYVDNDTSATVGRRPAYEDMLTDIRDGKVGGVVAWDLDRLHRQPIELERFIDLADSRKIALATVGGEADLSTDNGRLFARIKGAVAKSEVERKSARQKAAAKQRAEAGTAWWPSRPFGYQMPHKTQPPRLRPAEAKRVRDAYSAVLAGSSLHSIANAWNAAAVLTPKGNTWRGAQVRQLLMNARNAGLREYRPDKTVPAEVMGPADWPAIVDRDVFDAVRALLADPARRHGPTRGRKHLLTALAVCGACNHPMGSGRASSNGTPIYVCKSCHKVSRNAANVDQLVSAVVVGRLSRPDAADLLITEKRPDTDAMRDHAAVLRARQEEAAALFADGAITAAQLRVTTTKLAGALTDVESKMFDANRSRVFDGVIGADAQTVWDALPLDRRRAIVGVLVTVTIMPTGRGSVFDPDAVRTVLRR